MARPLPPRPSGHAAVAVLPVLRQEMLPCCPLLGRKRQGHPSFSSPFRWHVSIAGRGHCRPRCRLTGTGAQVRPSRERAPRVRASRAADASPPRTASSRGLHGRVRPPPQQPVRFPAASAANHRQLPRTQRRGRGGGGAESGPRPSRRAWRGSCSGEGRGAVPHPRRAGPERPEGKGLLGVAEDEGGGQGVARAAGRPRAALECGSAPHGGSGAVAGGPPEARCWHSVLTQVGTLCALWEASSSSATQGRRPCSPAAGASPTCALCPGAPSCTDQSRSPASPLWPPGFLPS